MLFIFRLFDIWQHFSSLKMTLGSLWCRGELFSETESARAMVLAILHELGDVREILTFC
jgi:hypothetical protein